MKMIISDWRSIFWKNYHFSSMGFMYNEFTMSYNPTRDLEKLTTWFETCRMEQGLRNWQGN